MNSAFVARYSAWPPISTARIIVPIMLMRASNNTLKMMAAMATGISSGRRGSKFASAADAPITTRKTPAMSATVRIDA
jgi:hypothetical protein